MILSRRLALAMRVIVASAWAGCLVVLGLWLMAEGARWLPVGRQAAACAGLWAVAAGVFVFMVMVADRLMPRVGRRHTMFSVEMAVLLLMLGSFAGSVLGVVLS